MRCGRTILFIVLFGFVADTRCQSRTSAELGFPMELAFPVSAETNAMGGAGVSIISNNALAANANPAAVGVFSLEGFLSAAYVPSLQIANNYIYPFASSNQASNGFAVSAGLPLNLLWRNLPPRIGIGVGYSNTPYNSLYETTAPFNLEARNFVDKTTFAMGIKYLVTFGIGYSLIHVGSSVQTVPGSSTSYQGISADNFGAFLHLPVLRLVSRLTDHKVLFPAGTTPFFDLTFGYALWQIENYNSLSLLGNVLPKEGDLGWNFSVGLKAEVNHHVWRWISFTWVRQANAALFTVDSSATPSSNPPATAYSYFRTYGKGLGNFQLYDNLVAGRAYGNVGVLKGWQVQLGEFFYLRGGSDTEFGLPTYSTYGWGAKLDGLVKSLLFFHLLSPNDEIAKSLVDHFDLEFDYSRAMGGPFDGEPFESLNLAVK